MLLALREAVLPKSAPPSPDCARLSFNEGCGITLGGGAGEELCLFCSLP